MPKEQYFPPEHAKGQFHCPICDVYAKQKWSHLNAIGDCYTKRNQFNGVIYQSNIFGLATKSGFLLEDWTISLCEHCNGMAVWFEMKMIYPKKISVEKPNNDLNEDIKKDYLEAANILNDSPRSAAAILRLSLQKLCKQLGEKGDNINNDIGELVKKGLNPSIQKSLDVLRITGNNAVHPGELDLSEDNDRVVKLFNLLNFIVQKMITEPKEINSFYENLPEKSKQAVEKRDGK